MIWYIENTPRHKQERLGLEELAGKVDWLAINRSRIDSDLRLMWDVEITVSNKTFSMTLRYPNHFPYSPPSVIPLNDGERWSNHQYGPGGELCLEYGPDNWHHDLTGADMLLSAHRLLQGEQGTPERQGEVDSRHHSTIGQILRGKFSRLVVTHALVELLAVIPESTVLSATTIVMYNERSVVQVIKSIVVSDTWTWNDTLPKSSLLGFEKVIALAKWPSNSPWPSTKSLSAFRSSLTKLGFELDQETYILIVRENSFRGYFLSDDDDSVYSIACIMPAEFSSRVDASYVALADKKVAILGCGSMGTKIATSLARSGVRQYVLVDDDIFLPENLVRNDLDWRDVGMHKAEALANKLEVAGPGVAVDVRRQRLGGQESSGSLESLIEGLASCDLLIDATADPSVFNYLCAVVAISKKTLVWAETFGGGFGGLIARCRPSIEPDPATMRRSIESWCKDRGRPIERPSRSYGGVRDLPHIADDSDVGVIAAHASRMAIDLLIPRTPSIFPSSVYMIGLSSGWIFDSPFETYPIDVGTTGQQEDVPTLDEADMESELAVIFKRFMDYKNAASTPEIGDQTSSS